MELRLSALLPPVLLPEIPVPPAPVRAGNSCQAADYSPTSKNAILKFRDVDLDGDI
jgi:hypothetical protein